MQNLTLLVRCASDVVLTHTPAGVPVAKVTLVDNETWKNADGTKGERATFFRATAWRKTGENLAQYFSKGKPIYVEASVQNSNPYQDKASGEWRASTEITIEKWQFVPSDSTNGNGHTNGNGAANTPTDGPSDADAPPVEADEQVW